MKEIIPYYDERFLESVKLSTKVNTLISNIDDKNILTYSDSLIDKFFKDVHNIIPIYYEEIFHTKYHKLIFDTYDDILAFIIINRGSELYINSINYSDDKICLIFTYRINRQLNDSYWIELRLNKFNNLLGNNV